MLELVLVYLIWVADAILMIILGWHDSWPALAGVPVMIWFVWRLSRWDEHHYEARCRALERQQEWLRNHQGGAR